jgi:hypothetical protein
MFVMHSARHEDPAESKPPVSLTIKWTQSLSAYEVSIREAMWGMVDVLNVPSSFSLSLSL